MEKVKKECVRAGGWVTVPHGRNRPSRNLLHANKNPPRAQQKTGIEWRCLCEPAEETALTHRGPRREGALWVLELEPTQAGARVARDNVAECALRCRK